MKQIVMSVEYAFLAGWQILKQRDNSVLLRTEIHSQDANKQLLKVEVDNKLLVEASDTPPTDRQIFAALGHLLPTERERIKQEKANYKEANK